MVFPCRTPPFLLLLLLLVLLQPQNRRCCSHEILNTTAAADAAGTLEIFWIFAKNWLLLLLRLYPYGHICSNFPAACNSGWWFGTFFFHILRISSSQLTFIFFRGVGIPPIGIGCISWIWTPKVSRVPTPLARWSATPWVRPCNDEAWARATASKKVFAMGVDSTNEMTDYTIENLI